MEPRTNADYLITDSIHIGKTEFVIGENQTHFGTMYVTWECKNGDNYLGGQYMDSRGAAEKDLLERAGQELEIQQQRMDKQPKGKERER